MIENNIKIPMIVTVVLEAFILLITLALIQGQEVVLQAYFSTAWAATTGIHVFPLRTVLAFVFRLVLSLSCLFTMLYYKGERRRIVALIFIALPILISVASPYIAMAASALEARKQGVDYYSIHSALTSAISLVVSPPGTVATTLYYIACGRYGISEPENAFDPNNYIQP
ncbi:MAG: hypothetical protein IKH46_11540 [Lachnospiraceae bacterium]|nr:hypothetical protein [Lachnospiraceae bacterium]